MGEWHCIYCLQDSRESMLLLGNSLGDRFYMQYMNNCNKPATFISNLKSAISRLASFADKDWLLVRKTRIIEVSITCQNIIFRFSPKSVFNSHHFVSMGEWQCNHVNQPLHPKLDWRSSLPEFQSQWNLAKCLITGPKAGASVD